MFQDRYSHHLRKSQIDVLFQIMLKMAGKPFSKDHCVSGKDMAELNTWN